MLIQMASMMRGGRGAGGAGHAGRRYGRYGRYGRRLTGGMGLRHRPRYKPVGIQHYRNQDSSNETHVSTCTRTLLLVSCSQNSGATRQPSRHDHRSFRRIRARGVGAIARAGRSAAQNHRWLGHDTPSQPCSPANIKSASTAKGFTLTEKQDFDVTAPTVFDVQLHHPNRSASGERGGRSQHASAPTPIPMAARLVLGQKELARALRRSRRTLPATTSHGRARARARMARKSISMASRGGNLPPKSSIREIRINSNPFSPEYDRPGFGRIEILTKPGMDSLHGQAFVQYNNEDFNSRSPLLRAIHARRPIRQQFFGVNLTVRSRRTKRPSA